eukprot:2163707-Amphidinium_carterae.1
MFCVCLAHPTLNREVHVRLWTRNMCQAAETQVWLMMSQGCQGPPCDKADMPDANEGRLQGSLVWLYVGNCHTVGLWAARWLLPPSDNSINRPFSLFVLAQAPEEILKVQRQGVVHDALHNRHIGESRETKPVGPRLTLALQNECSASVDCRGASGRSPYSYVTAE